MLVFIFAKDSKGDKLIYFSSQLIVYGAGT
jgi:hypothetical protein